MSVTFSEPLEELLPALHLLDGLLERSMQMADALNSQTADLPEPGLQDAARIGAELLITPGYPRYQPARLMSLPSSQVLAASRLGALQNQFGLSAFEVDVLLIALAPELDRRYEKLYAYLQDDARCCRPSVELTLNLLSMNAAEKLRLRSHFAPNAPLLAHRLVTLAAPLHLHRPSLLAQEIIIEASIVRYLLDEGGLDPDLSVGCSLTVPDTVVDEAAEFPAGLTAQLQALKLSSLRQPDFRLYLQSPDPVASAQFSQALASQLQRPLLTADLEVLTRDPEQLRQRLQRLWRDSWLQKAVLYLHPVEVLQPEPTAYPLLIQHLAAAEFPVVLAGSQPWQPSATTSLGMVTLQLPTADFEARVTCWQTQLAPSGLSVEPATLKALADRFRLTPTQITSAIATARNQLAYQVEPQPIEATLFAAARNQSGHQLAQLAELIQPHYSWDDLVLPRGQLTQLQEMCLHMQHRHTVFDAWGFDRKLALGKGINALFAGPPGTGKTMAAEVIAHSLQLDLYRIDLSQVVSKYIGETEKNLNRIFTAATNANAILLFDEADALFGKRTEVKDSHDRYANIEVGYLLQKMEAYEGLAILTTNLKSNLDEAFVQVALEVRRRFFAAVSRRAASDLDADLA